LIYFNIRNWNGKVFERLFNDDKEREMRLDELKLHMEKLE